MGILNKIEIQDAYIKEAGMLIKKIDKDFHRLNEDSRNTVRGSRIFRLYRHAHTLKGISGTCGCYKMEEAAKSITEIFRAMKDDNHGMSATEIDSVEKNLQVCEKLIQNCES
jgi:chemotaxis protein histidine kinase CheA